MKTKEIQLSDAASGTQFDNPLNVDPNLYPDRDLNEISQRYNAARYVQVPNHCVTSQIGDIETGKVVWARKPKRTDLGMITNWRHAKAEEMHSLRL